jgi:hypothetical protein
VLVNGSELLKLVIVKELQANLKSQVSGPFAD